MWRHERLILIYFYGLFRKMFSTLLINPLHRIKPNMYIKLNTKTPILLIIQKMFNLETDDLAIKLCIPH